MVAHGDLEIARSTSALRLLETSQPPAYYIPPADVNEELLSKSIRRSFCEWKGEASYFDLAVDEPVEQLAWRYENPATPYAGLANYYAFYAQLADCSVNGEEVVPNEGSFYGGWVTSNIVGPFKGGPGTSFW